MTVVQQLDAIIAHLETAREDAVKVDAGKVGAPGKRVRAVAQETKVACDTLRKSVLEARKAE